MISKLRFLKSLTALLFVGVNVYGQGTVDSSIAFNNKRDSQSPLNNGFYYKMQKRALSGTAYFGNIDYFVVGKVLYDGYEFSDILLMYDLSEDIIVTSTDDRIDMYSLISDKVSEFYLDGHHFINIKNLENGATKSNFFELLYRGELEVVSKEKKTYRQFIDNANQLVSSYDHKTVFYLKKDEVYYPMNSSNSFVNLFKEKKKQLKKFIREEKINFSKDPKSALLSLASHYEVLSK